MHRPTLVLALIAAAALAVTLWLVSELRQASATSDTPPPAPPATPAPAAARPTAPPGR